MKLKNMNAFELDEFLRFSIYDNQHTKKMKKVDSEIINMYIAKKNQLLLLRESLQYAIYYAQTH